MGGHSSADIVAKIVDICRPMSVGFKLISYHNKLIVNVKIKILKIPHCPICLTYRVCELKEVKITWLIIIRFTIERT